MGSGMYVWFVFGLCFLATGITAQKDLANILDNQPDCNVQIDLIILVDGSDSVKSSNFFIIKDWIKELANGFNINSGQVQMGVVQYSYWYSRRPMWRQKYIKTEIQLGKYKNYDEFSRAVDRIQYQGYQTFTAHAINKTVNYDFQGRHSRYPEAQRAIILLTDGHSTDADDLPAAINHAEKDAGVVIFAVGVGDYSIDELQTITRNDRRRIFELRNFNELTNIVYELPLLLQKACDCNLMGSVSNDCDVCTRQCICKPHVVGRRCDMCAPGFYNFTDTGCTTCQCDTHGTLDRIKCDKVTGKCKCRQGVAGERCEKCIEGRFQFPDCVRCDCNGFSTACSIDGNCINCANNRSGNNCETCQSGYYMSDSDQCVPCECNGNIDVDDTGACDAKTGKCLKCLNGTAGSKCQHCAEYYYGNGTNNSCTQCQCNIDGTRGSSCEGDRCTCDQVTGNCTCNANVVGKNCDSCDDGFWNLRNEIGCEACGCHGQGSVSSICDKITGKCECLPGHTGIKCEQCDLGHAKLNEKSACTSCDCNLSGTVKSSCVEGTCSCDAISGQCPCYPNVIGKSCFKCADEHWGFGSDDGCKSCACNAIGSLSPSCDVNSGNCECLPGHTGTKCETCDEGHYKMNDQEICKKCYCVRDGTIGSSCDEERCICEDITGQCACLPNVFGVSCDECLDDHWGFGSEEGCSRCDCNGQGSVSLSCDVEAGTCECLPGYSGTKCEACDYGFFQSDEDKRCKACECARNGTQESSCENDRCTCEDLTGQCACLSNVVGASCNECAENHWGFGSEFGCTTCHCNEQGSVSLSCDANTGTCDCLLGYSGAKCEKCDRGYFQNQVERECKACKCVRSGTQEATCENDQCTCEDITGQCSCLPNVVGASCNECAENHWGVGSEDGCTRCDCNQQGSFSFLCDVNTGTCKCLLGYSGTKCERCDRGYFQSNEEGVCKECECNSEGTNSSSCSENRCECDQFTGQCLCNANVVGKTCDTCGEGFWDLQPDRGCEKCVCYEQGSSSPVCNKDSGECQCLAGYSGIKCDQCDWGYTKLYEENACISCNCNSNGTEKSECLDERCSCDVTSGQCPCKLNVVGKLCTECEQMHWGLGAVDGCKACDCDLKGALSLTCNSNTGKCECLPGYVGDKCEKCDQGFFGDSCQKCECNAFGTESSTCDGDTCTCDAVSGQCFCYPNVLGKSCNKCADEFWKLASGDGCEPCGCHGRGSKTNICDKETGQCDCLPGHTGLNCENCKRRHSREKDESCIACDCNLSGTNSSTCDVGDCSCDLFTGQCTCVPNVIGVSCDSCKDNYWDFGYENGCQECGCHRLGSISQSCNKKTGKCECLAGHTGSKCNLCASGYSRKYAISKCKICRCDPLGTIDSSRMEGVYGCAPATGQCTCLPNVVGLSCDRCNDGFWDLASKEGCQSCGCKMERSLSTVCNKVTGKCECLPGHTGEKCEKCEIGFSREPTNELCKECKCNMYGRNASSCIDDKCACDSVTGQCSCLPHVNGLLCDRCEEGFWDLRSMQGCKTCECHTQGSLSTICEKKSGQCECVAGNIGRKCEKCDKENGRANSRDKCASTTINDEPTEKTMTSKQSTDPIKTTPGTTTTRRPNLVRTRRPNIVRTRRPYIPPTTRIAYSSGCNACSGTWPSYCHGWMCRRRWPHHKFTPSPRRCNYGYTTCQYHVDSKYGYNKRVSSYNVQPTTPPKQQSSKPYYGYRMYGNTNYYIPYQTQNTRSHTSTRSRSNSSPSQPRSYGLYRSLYGSWK